MRGSSFLIFTAAAAILVLLFFYIVAAYSHTLARRGRNIMYRDFYECGFRMIPDMRPILDIQFSVITIVFLIYDMEIVLLTPLLVNFLQLPASNILLVLLVLAILAASYWFEWEKYTLNWTHS